MEIQLKVQREQHCFETEQAREQRQHENELKLANKKNDNEAIVFLKGYAEFLRVTIQNQPFDSIEKIYT